MAKGLPNTDPREGRPSKDAPETAALMNKIKEEEGAQSSVLTEQLALISSFTEVMRNYIPKLGFIDAHTQALKLKQDQAFKVLEKIEGHLAKDAEEVGGASDGEDSDADAVDPEEETLDGPQAEVAEESTEDTREDAGTPVLERIADDVAAIRATMEESGDDARDTGGGDDEPDVSEKDAKDGAAPKKAKKLGAIGKFLKKIGKLFTVFNLIIVGIVAVLLTANSEIFASLKKLFGTIMKIFTQIIGLVIDKVLPVVTQVFGIVIDLVNQLLPPLMDIFALLIDVGMKVVDALIPPIMMLVDMLVPIIVSVVDVLMTVIMAIVDAVMPIVEMILNILMPIVEIVLGLILFLFETITKPIIEALLPVVEFVGDLLMGFFNAIATLWNGLLEEAASWADWIPGLDAEEIRSKKMDLMEKDESKDKAKDIDFSQDDEAINAQIQAKVDSGEINKTTAESLMKNKEKHAKDQAKRREEMIQKLDVQEVEVPKAGEDGEKMKLIQMDLSDLTSGLLGEMLFDPDSLDDKGNYDFYNKDGAPVSIPFPYGNKVMMAANAAVEGLQAQETGDGAPMDFAALLGVDETTIGQDLGDDSLDTAEAQADAAAGKDGGTTNNTQTVIGGSSTSSSNKTIIMEDASSGSPQDGRGFVAEPN